MFGERDAWRYETPYDFYDSDGLPVKNPEFFFAARDDDGTLIGFYFLEPRDGALFYGFGMRPDLTGRGLGEQFVLAGLEFAHAIYGWRRVVLHVAALNERAIRLYRRLGFNETGRHAEIFDGYGAVEFINMQSLAECGDDPTLSLAARHWPASWDASAVKRPHQHARARSLKPPSSAPCRLVDVRSLCTCHATC